MTALPLKRSSKMLTLYQNHVPCCENKVRTNYFRNENAKTANDEFSKKLIADTDNDYPLTAKLSRVYSPATCGNDGCEISCNWGEEK